MHPTLTRAFKTLVAAGVLAVINLTRPDAAAAPYLGTYDWLSFYHVASLTQSATYFAGPTESWGWLAARGTDNTDDRWRQITWDNDVTLNGVYVQEFDQFSGGTIGDYEVEYSADGTSGWTAVPTTYNFTGTGAHSVNFDSTVTARALRVRFPGGTYDQGTGGNGPGVFQLLARGNYAGGIDPADPQFNALRAPGYEGMLPAITFPGEVPQENGAQQYLRDGIITGDPNRTGWYPPPEGNELIQVDLGLATGGKLWNIQNVRLYAGTYYYYVPSTMNASISADGLTWSAAHPMTMVDGVLTATGLSEVGRYVRLTPTGPWINGYFLVHEVGVGAFPVPEPAGLLVLGGAVGLLSARRGQRRGRGVKAIAVAAVLLMAVSGLAFGAGPVSVADYNWLQLAPASVNAFIGGAASGGSGYGEPADFRWGDHVWIPNGTLTQNGDGPYWAGLQLDQPREIETVTVQWWTGEGTSLNSFAVQGSNDGAAWTTIGSFAVSLANPVVTGRERVAVDVADGAWQYLRVYMENNKGGDPLADDYVYGSSGRGGPGIYAIEPSGDGIIGLGDKVNWLNKSNFLTTVTNNGFTFNGLRYNDGWLYDDEGTRTGQSGNWDSGDYVQMDLTMARLVDEMVVVRDLTYGFDSFRVWYSDQPTAGYSEVSYLAGPTLYAPSYGQGATGRTFQGVTAQYWRITDAAGGGGYNLLNQVIVLGTVVPEPASAALLTLAAGGLLLRRRG